MKSQPVAGGELSPGEKVFYGNVAKQYGGVGTTAQLLESALEDRRSRRNLALDLGKAEESVRWLVPAFIEELRDKEPKVRRRIAWVLGLFADLPTEAVSALVEALVDPDSVVRGEACLSLAKFRPNDPVIAHRLIEATGNPAPLVRVDAIEKICELRIGGNAVMSALIECLGDSSWDVRTAASVALGKMVDVLPSLIPTLIDTLQNADVLKRVFAACTFVELGQIAACSISALIQALHDSEYVVRYISAYALISIAPNNPATPVALIDSLRTPDKWMLFSSAVAGYLAKIRPPIPLLLEALTIRNTGVRRWIAWVLGELLPVDDAVVSALAATLWDESNDEARRAICEALGRIGGAAKAMTQKTETILERVRSTDSSKVVRIQANMGLADFRVEGVVDHPVFANVQDSELPDMCDGVLFDKYTDLYVTYLARKICHKLGKDRFSCALIVEQLIENHGMKRTLSPTTVNTYLTNVEQLFQAHFDNPDFILFDRNRKTGFQFLPIECSREIKIVWDFLEQLFGWRERSIFDKM